MKIMLILRNDCANLALEYIYTELIKKGHDLHLYSSNLSSNHIRMFTVQGISVNKLEHLTQAMLNKFDIILGSRNCFDGFPNPGMLIDYPGYVFADNTTLYEGYNVFGDFIFAGGKHNLDTVRRGGRDFPTVTVGSVKCRAAQLNPQSGSKRILYIESGHYPFGRSPRRKLARMVIDICKAYPEYELVIKPRFLPDEGRQGSHRNEEHLYEYIRAECNDTLPGNLVLLETYKNLEYLIASSDTVISTYSSAYVEAVAAGKGLVLIKGLDSEETVDFRKERFRRITSLQEQSQCAVHYTEVVKVLPQGLRCDNEHFKYVVEDNPKVVETIVEAIEYIYDHYLCKGIYPDKQVLDFNNYKEQLVLGQAICFAELRLRRIQNYLRTLLFYYEHGLDKFNDFQQIRKEIDAVSRNKNSLQEKAAAIVTIAEDFIKNRFALCTNKFNHALLLGVLFKRGMYEDICESDVELLPEGYWFYMGQIRYIEGDFTEAITCLSKYLEISKIRKYDVTLVDRRECVDLAISIRAKCHQELRR